MLATGTTFAGRYSVRSLLGQGGMGAVYRAYDERLGREVALKVLRADLAADSAARARFLREGQIAAQIVHPNVVRTYDAGDDPAGPYLIQELLSGRTLDQLLPLPPARAAAIMHEVAGALGAIHSRGYVHCDVKPQNILLKPDGTPMLLDFGIARIEGTDTTTLIATPHYLAPERAQGEPSAAASDLYALGIILFQAVAGHPPFNAPSLHGIIQQHIDQPVPALGGADPATPILDRVIARLTEKRPADRYTSTDALRADLAAVAQKNVNAQPTLIVKPAVYQSANPGMAATPASASTPPVSSTVTVRTTAPPLPDLNVAKQRSAPASAWHKHRWLALALVPLLLLIGGLGLVRAGRTTEPNVPSARIPAVVATAAPASESTAAPSGAVVTAIAASPTVAATALSAPTAIASIPVPGVIGLPYAEAEQLLANFGLRSQLGDQVNNPAAAGIVLGSDPSPDTALPPGSPVTLLISAGPATADAPPSSSDAPPPSSDAPPSAPAAPQGASDDDEDNDKGKGENKGEGKGENKGKGQDKQDKDD